MADGANVACLIRIKNGTKTRAHVIVRPRFVIGRSMDVEVPIISSTISRRHIQIDITPEGISLTDLGSNNGTFINGIRLASNKTILIHPEDRIRLGANLDEFRFLDIPVPMEMQSASEQKGTMLSGMTELQKEIDEFGKKAIEEEKKIAHATMKMEEDQMRLRVQRELDNKKSIAEEDARQIVAQAQEKADRLLAKARQSTDVIQSEAVELHLKRKKELEDELQKFESSSKADAKAKADQIIQHAEREAKAHLEQSKIQAERLLQDARLSAKTTIEETKAHARHIVDEAKSIAESEIQEQKRIAIESTRATTLAEQERIIQEYRSTIDKLKNSQGDLEAKLKKAATDLGHHLRECLSQEEELKNLKNRVIEERHQLNDIQDDLKEAKAIVTRAEAANQEMELAKSKASEMQSRFEKFQSDLNSGLKSIADELNAKKQAAILEFEKTKKLQEDDLAKSKVEAIEKLKNTIKEEERKYLLTLEMRAVEISQAIESKLLPKIEADLQMKGTQVSLGSMLGLIRSSVDEVILQDKPSIKAMTDHLGVDPEKEMMRRTRNKRIFSSAAVAAILLLLVFGKDLFLFLRDKAEKSKYIDQVVAKRNAESIYTPVQSDDWKESYTGNILFLRYYYEAKTDEAYEKQWALKLNDLELLRSLKLNEDEMIRFIGKEAALVRQLWNLRESIDAHYIDEGMENMNKAEIQAILDMSKIVKSEETLASIRKIEKDFTMQFIKKRFGVANKIREPSNQ